MPVKDDRWPFHDVRLAQIGLSLCVFMLLCAIVLYNVYSERQRQRDELRTRITRKASTLVTQLESELNANIFLANGLVGHVTADPDMQEGEINTALRTLFKFGRHLRNIGIAPGNRISHLYPHAGNEAAIGLYYPDSPEQWPGVQRAIASHATVLAGPLTLRQGGEGLISRTPIYLEDGSYWGIISLVLRPAGLYAAAGISPEMDGLRLALRGRDGLGPEGEVFFGDPGLFELDAVKLSMPVPGGSWQAAAYPAGGWDAGQQQLDLLQWLGIALSALLALALLGYQRNRFAIEVSQKRLSAILETTPDGVILVDAQGLVRESNPAAARLFRWPASAMLGQPITAFIAPREGDSEDRLMAPGVNHYTGRQRDGETFPVEVTAGQTLIGEQRYVLGVLRDVSERQAMEQRLRQLATTDDLTGALNRRAFLELAEKAVGVARRHGRPLALLMIDADRFKAINDQHGHHAGDQVLVRLAQVTRETLRATDPLCRFGGEEFIALLPETSAEEAANMARRLLDGLRATAVDVGQGKHLHFTVSIGIAALSPQVDDLAGLIRAADTALYRAKDGGRDRWVCAAK